MDYVKRKASSKATHNFLRINTILMKGVQLDAIGIGHHSRSRGVTMASLGDKIQITATFADTLNRAFHVRSFHVHSCFIRENIIIDMLSSLFKTGSMYEHSM